MLTVHASCAIHVGYGQGLCHDPCPYLPAVQGAGALVPSPHCSSTPCTLTACAQGTAGVVKGSKGSRGLAGVVLPLVMAKVATVFGMELKELKKGGW